MNLLENKTKTNLLVQEILLDKEMPHKVLKGDPFEIIFVLLTFLQTNVFISNLKTKTLVLMTLGVYFEDAKLHCQIRNNEE